MGASQAVVIKFNYDINLSMYKIKNNSPTEVLSCKASEIALKQLPDAVGETILGEGNFLHTPSVLQPLIL